jgi:glycerol-3-phosphate O-acyltransferase
MGRVVEMPLWALIVLVGFAAVTFASHFLFPSVRWFFRRRLERVVAQLNTRLERPIEPFKLAQRYDMIQRLIYDPAVLRAVTEHARAEAIPESVAFERARRYAREIVPSFSASLYFGFAIRVAKMLSQSLYRVRLGHFDEASFRKIDPEATVVFVMNHRSNMDYVLVTWLAAERSALSYAVGEWARVWPLSRMIRAMGAYFIRRRSRGDLYRRVLARYVGAASALTAACNRSSLAFSNISSKSAAPAGAMWSSCRLRSITTGCSKTACWWRQERRAGGGFRRASRLFCGSSWVRSGCGYAGAITGMAMRR